MREKGKGEGKHYADKFENGIILILWDEPRWEWDKRGKIWIKLE